ncbi:MAG TPA: S41 family peptidase [Gemmatimonadaceae bacterium]|nr:S41 family peptidase [Gemmatimonadaceae bacterium]
MRPITALAIVLAAAAAPLAAQQAQQAQLGYYRFPAVAGNTVVFTAEGDLWRVPITGGVAQRLTSNAGEESHAAISPDGQTVAFSATYEGPTEVYTMPLGGGVPTRRTYEGVAATVVGWTPDGKVLYTTRRYSTLPNPELATVDPRNNTTTLVPLAQASDGSYDNGTLYFTRFAWQGSNTKRYRGGTAQNIWRFAPNAEHAQPLTSDYEGTSRSPMVWKDRVYFASDRDGTMNLWSMDLNGKDLKQHTRHADFDVLSPSLGDGKIVYQSGADLRVYDIGSGSDTQIPISLVSDFEQMREKWIKNPVEWITDVHLSPNGDRVVLTARGQLFVAPVQQGRLVEAVRDKKIRVRGGRFMPDGKTLLALTDQSGEVEFWRVPANGIGASTQLTNDAKVLRWDGIPSADGRYIAHTDKDQQLWLYDTQTKKNTRLAVNNDGGFGDVRWSPDGKWLAYVAPATNQFGQIFLYSVESGKATAVTSDRYDSESPTWSPDGKWLYFLSDRNLQSLVGAPWGSRAPEPFFDKQTMIFALALSPNERSPFQPDDELGSGKPVAVKTDSTAKSPAPDSIKPPAARQGVPPSPRLLVNLDGIERRLIEVPVPPGNYGLLTTDGKRLYFLSRDAGFTTRPALMSFPIENKDPKPETFMADVRGYELSLDGKKMLVRRNNDLLVVDAGTKAPTDLSKAQVNLKDWVLHFDPRDEWRQEFADAWRLERDYFYDKGMNGVDWPAMRQHYAPLVERVTDRAELSDILAQMVGELSALHIFVYGGDIRRGTDVVAPASLGARLTRDDRAGGYRVDHIYRTDPDAPREIAPLARFGVDVAEGDVIAAVNGVPTLSVPDIGSLLRDQADHQVLLRLKPKSGGEREVVVTPVSQQREQALRYSEWEYTRRLAVEKKSENKIGYVHLRAMGSNDIAQFARDYYPAFNRDGLIIDVRHNNGGNIDSWLLERLMRKAWFYWQARTGNPYWNMQYAFRGHMVVLTDENTASDGEAFSEGFRRLGLGKVIGTRTWGGEIWLSSSNVLVDRGIATAAEMGVYGPERQWLIEGHGVDPDIVVDNEPHATFNGQDAQLDAAIAYLQGEIKAHPIPVPAPPPYPNKSLKAAVQAGATKAAGAPKRNDER